MAIYRDFTVVTYLYLTTSMLFSILQVGNTGTDRLYFILKLCQALRNMITKPMIHLLVGLQVYPESMWPNVQGIGRFPGTHQDT